ncbi:MAG: hypothetical protein RTV41_11050 [Candidatus Thorarchaeota archaeon]
MKHAREALALMILLVTPLLLSGVIAPITYEVKTTQTQSPVEVNLPSYENITSILAYN